MESQEMIQDTVLAHLSKELQSKQKSDFQRCLEKDDVCRKQYEELGSMWFAVRWGSRRDAINCADGWQRLRNRRQKRKRVRLYSAISLAASLVLLIGFLYWWTPSEEVVVVANDKSVWESADVTLVLSSGEMVSVKNSNHSDILEGGSVIHSDSSGLSYLKGETNDVNTLVYNELIVPKCGEFRLTLSDGSFVILNAASKLRYPVNFAKNCREVYLEGEACFEVSKDSDRPFVVHTAYTSVQVLGTLFNVSSYEKDENTVVTLVNGKVRVSADSVLKVLQPNEQLVLNHETNDMEVKKVVADNYVAWTRGLFRFEGIPLRLLMMKLARWYDITYEFKDEGLEKISFTGGVWKYDDIHLILEMIEEIARVELKMIDNKVIIDKKRR